MFGNGLNAQGATGPAAGAAPGGLIKDVTSASFRQDVIAESMNQPVLVDFWAPWCGPCKQLTPVIEKAVTKAAGKVKLAKMNIDEHPGIAGQLGIQSIPAVIAFSNGQPVDGFMGALPESQIDAFIEKIAGPSGPSADRAGDRAGGGTRGAGDAQGAAQLYAAVLQQEPENVEAIAGLARLHFDLGDIEGAQALPRDDACGQGERPGHQRRARRHRARGAGGEARRYGGTRATPRSRPQRPSGALRSRHCAQCVKPPRRSGRATCRYRQARSHLERRRRAQAAAPVLRGLGLQGRSEHRRAAQALAVLFS